MWPGRWVTLSMTLDFVIKFQWNLDRDPMGLVLKLTLHAITIHLQTENNVPC